MQILKNKKGGALPIVIFGAFMIVFLVNIYLIIGTNLILTEKKNFIKNKIENSYSQNINTYTEEFNKFCKIRDFINPKYIPNIIVVRKSDENLFNIEEVQSDSKVPLNSTPLTKEEAIGVIDTYVNDINIMDKINNALTCAPAIIYYNYNEHGISIENVINFQGTLKKENKTEQTVESSKDANVENKEKDDKLKKDNLPTEKDLKKNTETKNKMDTKFKKNTEEMDKKNVT